MFTMRYLFGYANLNYDGLLQNDPRKLIPLLCHQFYHLGWVTGTGGGISIKNELEIFKFEIKLIIKESLTSWLCFYILCDAQEFELYFSYLLTAIF